MLLMTLSDYRAVGLSIGPLRWPGMLLTFVDVRQKVYRDGISKCNKSNLIPTNNCTSYTLKQQRKCFKSIAKLELIPWRWTLKSDGANNIPMDGANFDDLVSIWSKLLMKGLILNQFFLLLVYIYSTCYTNCCLHHRALIVNPSGTILDFGEDRRAMRVKTIRCWRDHRNLIYWALADLEGGYVGCNTPFKK